MNNRVREEHSWGKIDLGSSGAMTEEASGMKVVGNDRESLA